MSVRIESICTDHTRIQDGSIQGTIFFKDEDEERPEKPRHYGLTEIRALENYFFKYVDYID